MRIFLLLLCFLASAALQAADNNGNLDSLLAHRHFFQLQRELQNDTHNLPVHRKLFYQAFLHNFFHDLVTSNKEINELLEKYKKLFTHNEISNLLMKKIDNHVKLYQYREAHLTTELLLKKYRTATDAELIRYLSEGKVRKPN